MSKLDLADPQAWVEQTIDIELKGGFGWVPHIYERTEQFDSNEPSPRYVAYMHVDCVPVALRQHLHVSDRGIIIATSTAKPRVWTSEDTEESYCRLDNQLRLLTVQNRRLDEVFMGREVKVTAQVRRLPSKARINVRAPLVLAFEGISVEI